MGNSCCQDHNVTQQQLQQLESHLNERHGQNEFYLADWPTDENIQRIIVDLKTKDQLIPIFENQRVMKHKYLDKYYIGEWNSLGYPEGKGLMLQPETYIYFGEFKVVPHGKGVLQLFKERLVYEGELNQGRGQGIGKISNLDDKYTFEGRFRNSFPSDGRLIINNVNDSSKSYCVILDDFPNKKTIIQYGDGRTFEGFVNRKSFAPQGEGKANFTDGSHYQGNWEDGEMHGKGTFYWTDGSSYHGDYVHGRKHGLGTFTFPSQKYYEGEWVNGKQHGKGALFDPSNVMLKKGVWKDGLFDKAEND